MGARGLQLWRPRARSGRHVCQRTRRQAWGGSVSGPTSHADGRAQVGRTGRAAGDGLGVTRTGSCGEGEVLISTLWVRRLQIQTAAKHIPGRWNSAKPWDAGTVGPGREGARPSEDTSSGRGACLSAQSGEMLALRVPQPSKAPCFRGRAPGPTSPRGPRTGTPWGHHPTVTKPKAAPLGARSAARAACRATKPWAPSGRPGPGTSDSVGRSARGRIVQSGHEFFPNSVQFSGKHPECDHVSL